MTTISIDLRQALSDELGSCCNLPATVEIDDLLEFNDIDRYELDIDDLLAEQGMIADIWHISDVKARRPDLNEWQCWEVLKECHATLIDDDAYRSDTIHSAAEELFGPPASPFREKVLRCDQALRVYEDELIDLLADARHWCDARELDFSDLNSTAYQHYLTQRDGKE